MKIFIFVVWMAVVFSPWVWFLSDGLDPVKNSNMMVAHSLLAIIAALIGLKKFNEDMFGKKSNKHKD